MIRTGNEAPSAAEQQDLNRLTSGMDLSMRRYFDRNKIQTQDQTLTHGMRDFHNKYIKELLLYRVGLEGGDKKLIDVACGVGSDIHIWRRGRVSFVLGIDYSADNINGPNDSIYKRYVEIMARGGGREKMAQMLFVNGDSTKNYLSGEAGASEEEKNILRAVIGRTGATGPIPPYAEELTNRLKGGADCMSCIFSLHYFFETPEKVSGFLKNIAENLKVGGYFIGCCFDGQKVFDLLRQTPTGSAKTGMEKGSVMWSITKQYTEDDLPDGEESVGLPVDVKFVTIGETHREYLVSFKYLTELMKSIGCELLSAEDLKPFKMSASTNTFDASWEMAKKGGKEFPMMDALKEFSFLNRWFVFKRKSSAGPAAEAAGQAGLAALKEAAAASVRRGPVAEGKEADEEEEGEEEVKSRVEETAEAAVKNRSAAALGAAPPGRTVPVAPGALAAPEEKRTYTAGELFQFYAKAAEKDVLGISDKGAGQWLAPTAPFPIEDPYDADTLYPSLNHYLAAMRYRVASNTPEVAATLFGREGTIHQKFNRKRLLESEGGKRPISEKRDKELLEEEAVEVREGIRPSAFKKYKSTFDEAVWATKKDEVLREGLRQRWETDARFRKIVEAARDKGKTLLYYAPGANSSNLGGVRRNSGMIEGENKMGKIIMELAGF